MSVTLVVEPLEVRALPAADFRSLPVLPSGDAAALDHVRAVAALGARLGRDGNAFLRAGDSNTNPAGFLPASYLTPFGETGYDPGAAGLAATHPELLDTLAAARASFSWVGTAAYPAWTSADVLAHVAGEVAANRAGVALVMVGTNDIFTGVTQAQFRQNLVGIVSELTRAGVVPVLSTVPDVAFGDEGDRARVEAFNQVIADVAGDNRVPLWNFWRTSAGLPDRGVDEFGIHLSHSPKGGGSLWPDDLKYGQNVRNLQALQILDWFRQTVSPGGPWLVEPREGWRELAAGRAVYAVGRDIGFSPAVDVYDADTGELLNRFLAFRQSFAGGVRVATGDVNGDGVADVVCATGAGTAGRVKVFSGKDGAVLAAFAPFGPAFTGGVNVAVGDLDANGTADLVVGMASGGSWVKTFRGGTFAPAAAFPALPESYRGGVSVAAADVNNLGPVIAVGAAVEAPVVELFRPDGSLAAAFQAEPGSGFGVTLAAVDLDGNGSDDLAVARSSGGGPVRILNPVTGATRATFAATPATGLPWGLRLGTVRAASGPDTLLVGNGPGSPVGVAAYRDLSGVPRSLPPEPGDRAFGLFVG